MPKLDPNLLALIGLATGVIGTIMGIAGFVLGWIGYRRSNKFKSLDLRLELRKQLSDLRAAIETLPALIDRGRRSRGAVLAGTGLSSTGAAEAWKAQCVADMDEAKALAKALPETGETYGRWPHQNLETELVRMHELGGRVRRLNEKYIAEYAADDKSRDDIRAAAIERISARTP